MKYLNILKNVVIGAPLGIAAVTALPILGGVGVITGVGLAVGSLVGAAMGIADALGDN